MELKGWIKAEWGVTENNRRAKYYKLTRTGRKQLEGEVSSYNRLTEAIAKVLQNRLAESEASCDEQTFAISFRSAFRDGSASSFHLARNFRAQPNKSASAKLRNKLKKIFAKVCSSHEASLSAKRFAAPGDSLSQPVIEETSPSNCLRPVLVSL